MRKLCWWAIPCSGAIFTAIYLLPESFLFPAGGLCLLGALFSLLFRDKTRLKVALTALGLAAGFLWTGCYGLLLRAPAHALADKPAAVYTLTVADFPAETSRGAVFPARLHIEGAIDPKVQIYAEADALELRPGDAVSLSLSLARSDRARGNSVDYYQSKGIYLLGYARDGFTLLRRPERPPITTWPQYTAKALKTSLLRSVPDDVSGMVIALITGDKSLLPAGMYAAFRRAGLAHVVAVSGMHISFLAGLMAFFLGRHRKFVTALTLAVIFFFAALAGNSPSALRAAFMSGAVSLAPMVKREDDKPTTLSAVLVLLLLPCPYAAASVSLQLSFAAMVGIYLISQPLNERWTERIPKWDKPLGKLIRRGLFVCSATLSVTFGALLFTMPLTAFHFHSVSLMGPLSNLFTLWAASAAFLGGLFTALMGLISPGAAAWMGWLAAWPARWMILVAKSISRLPFASLGLQSGYMLLWFCVAYAIVLLWVAAAPRIRPIVPVAALLSCLFPALLVSAWPALSGTLTITALDVGQGASTLFCSKGHSVLVDCGGNSADDPGDVAADRLQALGTSRLDALILTHFHTDHSGGVPELLERLDVATLIVPSLAEDDPYRDELLSLAAQYGCKVIFLADDTIFQFGDATFTLYAPLGGGGENEEGLSVLCTDRSFDALITGDMNSVVERRLVKYYTLPDIELLFVGHHGSRSSTSEDLLLAAAPETAVISCGYNAYGHPAPETLERLGAAGCGIYRTDLMGSVTFTIKEEET